jgi:hypothetical protein
MRSAKSGSGSGGVGAAALAMILLAGCASVVGGSRGRIREIQAEEAAGCRYLGVVESSERSGWSMSDDEMGAMSHVRKRISAMGGNAYVLTHGDSARSGVVVRADVYRCR